MKKVIKFFKEAVAEICENNNSAHQACTVLACILGLILMILPGIFVTSLVIWAMHEEDTDAE